MVVHAYNPCNWEVEAIGFGLPSELKPELHSETLSQNEQMRKKKRNNDK